ncbi:exodeoxyribonuclease V subunit beta [Aestuariibacter salexigens]|uniref:exodeoxyribonuclease V subunit beta n=1 Tax=Aestuariibacter salexigens TaxID=226010 RepID=UPI00041CDEBA|nr:exodeoxyribonuclease V subunit beta [Aestuariibacter salexigens]
MQAQLLNTSTLPLYGRHLIEASAGTGKTFNITRLYLRLLLERRLSVQQILVMTFTKAATEELRGRIASMLTEAYAELEQDTIKEPCLEAALHHVDRDDARRLLEAAMLEMDDASIFTIHGFCARIVKEQAFNSAMTMDLRLETDLNELRLDAVRDWLRETAQQPQQFALLMEQGWHQPHEFYRTFSRALTSTQPTYAIDVEQLEQQFEEARRRFLQDLNVKKRAVLDDVHAHQEQIVDELINTQKGAKREQRLHEWQVLNDFLADSELTELPKAVSDFIHGRRYPKKEYFTQLFAPIKSIKDDLNNWFGRTTETHQARLAAVDAMQLAATGIDDIKQRIARQKARLGVVDYDDLILSVHTHLHHEHAQHLVDAMRGRYPVALVDEFQDTDSHQYEIFNRIYPSASEQLGLFMIGDPKQAIYGFRGGDIFAYLEARGEADAHWVMDTNWRSSAEVITGYNRLFWGSSLDAAARDLFGYGIHYEQVKATDKAKAAASPLVDPQSDRRALTYVLATQTEEDGNKVNKDTWRARLTDWFGAEIHRLLRDVRLGDKAVEPGDIAILVRSRTEAEVVQAALAQAQLSSVFLSNKHLLFATEQARDMLTLLTGIWECEKDDALIAALSTPLMGGSAERLLALRYAQDDSLWEAQRESALALRNMWLTQGCMAMILTIMQHYYRPLEAQRERALTNTLHLAEILQKAARRYRHPGQLLAHFKQQIDFPQETEEAEQRLESDMALIKIVTQHSSKGLEYPIVFIPFASDYSDPTKIGLRTQSTFYYHPDRDAKARFQLGISDQALTLTREEGQAEALRLLYVAVTRASHRCYIGIAPFNDSHHSALGRALDVNDPKQWQESVEAMIASSRGCAGLINASSLPQRPQVIDTQDDTQTPLVVANVEGHIDRSWRLASFSSLARQTHTVSQQQKDRADFGVTAHRETEQSTSQREEDNTLRFTLKKGADAGNLLHDILEHTDFTVPNWQQTMTAPAQRFGGLDEQQQRGLIAWLDDVLSTPLPTLVDDQTPFTLRELHWPQTLREAEFYFPIEGLNQTALFQCLAQHRGEPDSVGLRLKHDISGMMHGFIDLIFEHKGRYYVADYKSTYLGDRLEDYDSESLRQNNQSHLYDLQYLIYSVALHRYLAVRIDNYHPATHFGGVYYLYLRGMSSRNKNYSGVFSTAIDVDLLTRLDNCFSLSKKEAS